MPRHSLTCRGRSVSSCDGRHVRATMTDRSSRGSVDPSTKSGPKPPPGHKSEVKPAESHPNPDSDLPPETEESDVAEKAVQPPDETDEEIAQLRRRYLLRRFWHTAFRFWTTPGYSTAWLLSAALLVIILLNLAASYAM